MTDEQIKKIALANGFELKARLDGRMDLHPYVYDFAKALLKSCQPEIDALKYKLAVTDDGFKAAETLLKNLESENAAPKTELRTLRDGIQTMGDALADGVWAHLITSDDDLNALDAGISSMVGKLTALQVEVERLRGLLHDLPPLCEIERLQRNAAAPTPPAPAPAPEVNPVAWVNSSNLISAEIDRARYGDGGPELYTWKAGQSDYHNTALYTRPANDGLRKAAEEVAKDLAKLTCWPRLQQLGDKLRAELDKDKSC